MSWDFGMYADLGGPEKTWLGHDANYTYNVSKMYYDAFSDFGTDGIRMLSDRQGEACIPMLERAIQRMQDDKLKYLEWNPSNGWGNYQGALDLLRELLTWCQAAPKAYLSVT